MSRHPTGTGIPLRIQNFQCNTVMNSQLIWYRWFFNKCLELMYIPETLNRIGWKTSTREKVCRNWITSNWIQALKKIFKRFQNPLIHFSQYSWRYKFLYLPHGKHFDCYNKNKTDPTTSAGQTLDSFSVTLQVIKTLTWKKRLIIWDKALYH